MGNTDDPRHAPLASPSLPVYPFTTAELARLAHDRAAVQAGFSNDAVAQVPAPATGCTPSVVLTGELPGSPAFHVFLAQHLALNFGADCLAQP
jgi:hypothetical protein